METKTLILTQPRPTLKLLCFPQQWQTQPAAAPTIADESLIILMLISVSSNKCLMVDEDYYVYLWPLLHTPIGIRAHLSDRNAIVLRFLSILGQNDHWRWLYCIMVSTI